MKNWLMENYQFVILTGACVAAFAAQGWWLRKVKFASVPWPVWIVAAGLLFGGWQLAEQAGKSEGKRIQGTMESFARLYGDELENRGHWRLPDNVAGDDPLYLKLIETEKTWQKLNPNVSDIYTLRKRPDGKNVFLVDSETDYNHNGRLDEAREQRTPVGEVYDVVDEDLERVFQGVSNFNSVPVTDRWGTWVSAHVPLRDPSGQVEGVLGVDFDAHEFAAAIANAKLRVIVFIALIQLVLLGSSMLNSVLRAQIEERKRTEEQLRSLSRAVEQSPASIVITNAGGGIEYVNLKFTQVTGYGLDEVRGKNPRVLKSGATSADDYRRLWTTISQGGEWHGEFHNKKKNGELYWESASISPILDAAGCITHFLAIKEDITERKRAQEELTWKTAFLEAQVNSSIDGVLVVDQEEKKSLQNQRFVDLLKIPQHIADEQDDENQLRWVTDMTRNPEQFVEKVAYLYAHPNEISRDEIELKDGTMLDRYSSPVVGKDGKYYGRIWTFRDITERKRAEMERTKMARDIELLLASTGEGIFAMDQEGRCTLINRAGAEMLGRQPGELLGQKIHELVHHHRADGSPDPQEECKIISAFRKDEGIRVDTEFFRRKDGTLFPVEYASFPIHDGGKIVGAAVSFSDITERKRAEAALAAASALLETLLGNTPDHIYFKDRESRFIRASSALATQFKLRSADELIGKRDFDFFADAHARPAYEDEQRIIQTGQPIIGKTEKETWPDGRVTWVLTSKLPLRNVEGEIIGTFGISKDVTSIKEAEARLAVVHQQLLETSRQAGMAEVATSVLHNVGNVLNSVNVSATIVADNTKKSKAPYLDKVVMLLNDHAADLGAFMTNDPKGRQLPGYLSKLAGELAKEQQGAIAELESLRKHVEHIKDIVAMQQSYAKVSGIIETLKVTDLVEDALSMNAGSQTRHQVQVVREYGEVPPVTLDKHKVLQVLVNLIRNAQDACDASGRADKRLAVRVTNGDNQVRISISDNGVGIPAESLTRIFNHGFTTKKDGHGFGLHSGALAAKEMGGALTAHSAGGGQGATFALTLPIQPPKRTS